MRPEDHYAKQEEDCIDFGNKPNKPNHRRAATNFIPNCYL